MAGYVCHTHFEDRSGSHEAQEAREAECIDCQAAKAEAVARIQRDHTIDPTQPYGQHIALTCVNHPELRWSTKNIDSIGSRSIFYSMHNSQPECACPGRDLRLVGTAAC